MGNIIKINPAISALIQNSFTKELSSPFIKEIFLIDTRIAGTTFLKLDEIEPSLNEGDAIIFIREPDNKYDKKAICLTNENGVKLGYIPKEQNEILAHLLDAGKLIFGKLKSKKWQGKWLKLEIQVYLKD